MWRRARTAGLLGIACCLALAAAVAYFYSRAPDAPEALRYTQSRIAGYVQFMDAVLAAVPVRDRASFIARFPQDTPNRILPDPELHGRLVPPSEPWELAAANRIRADSRGLRQFAIDRVTGDPCVSFDLLGQRYWLVIAKDGVIMRDKAGTISLPLLALLLALGMTLFISLTAARKKQRTVQSLLQAARAIEHGGTPAPIAEEAGGELGALITGFNTMANGLQRFETERRLILAGISHDLRTPLTRLRLGIEIADKEIDFHLREGMIQDVEDMDAILEQFLGYAKDGNDEKPRLGDLNNLVGEICHRYSTTGHDIDVRLIPMKQFRFRHLAMRRMIANVVDNAVKYGGPEVVVSTNKDDDHA